MTTLPIVDLTMAELRCVYPALAHVAEETIRHPIDPETAEWLDGPSFYRWLRENGLTTTAMFGPSMERRFNRWKNGAACSLSHADKLCCRLDLHISEIPDHCWRDSPKNGTPSLPITKEKHERIMRAVDAGETVAEVAKREGIAKHTIWIWRRKRAGTYRRSGSG